MTEKKLLPREPTREMYLAGLAAIRRDNAEDKVVMDSLYPGTAAVAWRAMWDAVSTNAESAPDGEDMAEVGRALMQAIEDYKTHPFMKGWHPAQCPSEIIGDLLNALDEDSWTPRKCVTPAPAAQPADGDVARRIVETLRIEALASKELHPDDSDWPAMLEAVDFIEQQQAALATAGTEAEGMRQLLSDAASAISYWDARDPMLPSIRTALTPPAEKDR